MASQPEYDRTTISVDRRTKALIDQIHERENPQLPRRVTLRRMAIDRLHSHGD